MGQTAEGQEPSLLMSLLPIIIIFAIIYFLMIRPQSKRQKEKEQMLEALKKGDRVVTAGGIHGTIEGFREKEGQVILRIAKDVKINVTRNSISSTVGDDDNEKSS
ncbi:MAG: preprotein translocase subunit YajC [Candidatus Marinimicrobia bacterium]|nr:preprotein translocase subunit YajC [Candidatus Neomarinimicrobiota bacterium]MCF7829845.1 preprotein translocase subunit YajC [Candidatus Neomarinimicrobiota bacterium]MCF7882473.1 preprotein translocase subunit YajC [Candidatus Neomarinimicrobiota bacterium]